MVTVVAIERWRARTAMKLMTGDEKTELSSRRAASPAKNDAVRKRDDGEGSRSKPRYQNQSQ